jgi:CheY-like chemotaxis protein
LTHYLKSILIAGSDASRMVDRLKEFHRPGSKQELRMTLDLNVILKQALELTKPRWKTDAMARGISIGASLELNPLPAVKADPSELREALTNLIFNAVDAMPTGGSLLLRSRHLRGAVLIEVEDSGIGMTEEEQQRCLEPFFTTKGEKGTGLGLAMVYGIVERHGGTISIESAKGIGTRFILSLPAAGEMTPPPKRESSSLVERLKVLVVDDQEVVGDLLAELIRQDGHEVEFVDDASRALDLARDGSFHAIFTDQVMPGMCGVELCEKLREVAPGLATILVTGYGADEDESFRRAADVVVSKPLSAIGIRQALATALSRRAGQGSDALK